MRRKEIRIFACLIVACGLLVATGFRIAPEAQAAASLGVRTEVQFDFTDSEDGKNHVPTIEVYKGDFATGITTVERYYYPEKAFPIRKDTGSRGNNEGTYLLPSSNGYIAYWTTTKPTKLGEKDVTSLLYSFDLTTKKWGLVAEAPGLEITFFPRFGAYATIPPYGKINQSDKAMNAKTYDLKTKRLILSTHDTPKEDGDTLKYLVGREKTEIGYDKKPFKYTAAILFKLDKQGRKTELGDFYELNKEKPLSTKVGDLTYTNYYDKKKKEEFFGFNKGKTFTPLDDPGYESEFSFSPNDKYVFITEYPSNRNKYARTVDYKTKIVDAKTGKILHVLPMFNNINFYFLLDWNYGDEIVRLNFWEADGGVTAGYVHLASGTYTQAQDSKQENERTHHFYAYNGSYEGLLSPQTPAHLTIDGQTVGYGGQGTFVSEKGKWFVGAQDFADRIGGTVTVGSKDLTLKAGERSVTIALTNTVAAFGKQFVSVNELARGFGYVTAQYSGGEYGPRSIALYSSGYTEKQFLAQHPEAESVNEYDEGYYKLNAGIPEFVGGKSEEYRTYVNGGMINLITFKNGRLHGIELEKSLDSMERGVSYYDPQKTVLKALGTGKQYASNDRWGDRAAMFAYPSNGFTKLLMFKYGSFTGEVYIIDEDSPTAT